MSKGNKNSGGKNGRGTTTTTTSLPGLEGVQVIVSKPSLVKENSSKITKK